MTPEQVALLADAAKAASSAHAPYSKFNVGAAVLTDAGIFTGANIENASTNLGICAERVAIAHARMNGGTTIIGIAVSCVNALRDDQGRIDTRMTMPCGACRQWMAELAPNAWLITNGSDQVYTLQELLPQPFTLNS
jgi:cytidine deaminase